MITTEQRSDIMQRAQLWASESNLTQNDIAKISKINNSYLSNMWRGNFTMDVGGKDVAIADKWFYMLAKTVGYSIRKQYWATIQTTEFEKMIHELQVAKSDPRVTTIINDTGLGKTYAVERFCQAHPAHTYKITVNSMHKVHHILAELAELVGSAIRHNPLDTLLGVARKLREIKMMGHQPLIIIDEAENLKLPVIQMLKGMYDNLVGYASIVLIGTTQLIDALDKMRNSNRNGAPQFYRRIKAGIRIIPAGKDFKPFFERFKIDDKGLRQLLSSLCTNYGELHDYLEPALREADEHDRALTEDFFRLKYNLPKFVS